LPESTKNNPECLKTESSEIDMNTIADFPEHLLDKMGTEGVIESVINLDTTLTVQNVVKLHEKLKQSYSVNNTIEINASQVSSIDTATLQLLVALKKDADKQQKEVVLVEPSLRFIESAGLLGLLEILAIDA
jgi:anti-anti-sigma regulatory factor